MTIQHQIENILTVLSPNLIEVVDESHKHNVPKNAQSHFKVVIVSAEFEGLNLVGRHRKIYGLLAQLMQNPIHALALHTFTPDEWNNLADKSLVSPNCLGGNKQEP